MKNRTVGMRVAPILALLHEVDERTV